MSTKNTGIVRRSKVSSLQPPDIEVRHRGLIHRLNAVGEGGIWRIEVKGPRGLKKMFSGLLLKIVRLEKATIYVVINGGKNEIRVEEQNQVNFVHWRNLFEEDQDDQFVPLDNEGQVTFDPEKVQKIEKVDHDGWKRLVNKLTKGEVK